MASRQHTYIVDDLWPDIFNRVSAAEALCRFRCVCKSWNSFLSSPEFIKDRYSTTTTKSYLLLSTTTLYNPQPPTIPGECFTNLHTPPILQSSPFKIPDAINGVVCATLKHSGAFLWTPTITNKYVRIPEFPPSFEGHRWETGFGFDTCKNDFKLLKINLDGDGRACGVFSVKSGVWRVIKSLDPKILVHKGGVFINGCIHWVMRKDLVSGILVFDCEGEEFRTMEFPEDMKQYQSMSTVAHKCRALRYGGMLSLLYKTKEGFYDVWGMEEYGVKSTWKKVMRINGGASVVIMEDGVVEEDAILPYRPRRWGWHDDGTPYLGVILKESMFITDPSIA